MANRYIKKAGANCPGLSTPNILTHILTGFTPYNHKTPPRVKVKMIHKRIRLNWASAPINDYALACLGCFVNKVSIIFV